jgi:hypothetical protein
VIVREAGIEISNGTAIIASIPKKDEEFDLQTLSDYMVTLKRDYPEQDSASVLMEALIPYDYLIRVMDVVRAVEVPIESEDQLAGEDRIEGEELIEAEEQYELFALFTEISVGDAP